MESIIGGLISLGMALYVWFGIVKQPAEESATGFVKVWKLIFGIKGYIITAKIIAFILLGSSIAQFYKYFTA